jgi:hypothetical protein
MAPKVSKIERGRGIVVDVGDVLKVRNIGCKTVGNLGYSQSTKEETFLL